ncbi:MAG: hypothetical protein ACOZNI_04595 [Myxococcota bacterium]
MSELVALQCEACGGAVAFGAGAPEPRCLFCGTAQLVEVPLPEEVEPPAGFLPFRVDEDGARAAFRAFASRSIWYPGDLRHARLKLHALLLPAWSWQGTVETHWNALVRDTSTKSDKRPVAGRARMSAEGVLIPASATLSRKELEGISPFEPDALRPVGEAEAPHEVGSLTRTAARKAAMEGLLAMHAAALTRELSPTRLRTAAIYEGLEGGPLLLPVWIGAYRRGEKVFRVVVNGQTGKLVGKAPLSWIRIAFAVAVVLALLGGIVAVIGAVALWEAGYRPVIPW